MSLSSLYAAMYSNIEAVNIDRADVLDEPIIQIHNVLTGMENDIQELHAILQRYSYSIQDSRFDEVVTVAREHCLKLNEAAEDLYNAQQALARLHEKIMVDYEDGAADIIAFRKLEFSFPNIAVDASRVMFNKTDMMRVWHALGVFNGNTKQRSEELRRIPDNISGWWDQQKEVFRSILNDIADRLIQLMAPFSDYRDHLGFIIVNL